MAAFAAPQVPMPHAAPPSVRATSTFRPPSAATALALRCGEARGLRRRAAAASMVVAAGAAAAGGRRASARRNKYYILKVYIT